MSEENNIEQELAEMTAIAKRAMADLANYKRQVEEEKAQLLGLGKITVLSEFLPVVDNFERAFANAPDSDWAKGIENIKTQLEGLIAKSGLERIPTDGNVDPNMHEVVTTAPGEQDSIIEVLENGYTFNGRVIRAAKVVAGQS